MPIDIPRHISDPATTVPSLVFIIACLICASCSWIVLTGCAAVVIIAVPRNAVLGASENIVYRLSSAFLNHSIAVSRHEIAKDIAECMK